MSHCLQLGQTASGKPFTLPLDAVAQTFGILAIRGAGKTSTAVVMAEEMCKHNLPWICFDPVGVWWGIRASREGKPGGYPVVVIGGQHADVPLDRLQGKQLADALMAEPICAVIDLSQESKRFWHTYLTDFCLELMMLNPDTPRHLFIEEAPEFVPQRTRQDLTARCKEAIERLIRLGRNRGYGCTLISQRPATVDKDVLSQVENLLVMRTSGPHDRKALGEWIEAKASDAGLERFLKQLAGLETGSGWFWSPHWLKQFEKVSIRKRETFHPGETRQVGVTRALAELSEVKDFVNGLTRRLSVQPATVKPSLKTHVEPGVMPKPSMDERVSQLEQRLREAEGRARDAEHRVDAVRKMLQPQWASLQTLFGELGNGNGHVADKSVFDPWLKKAGRAGAKRMLEILIERTELTKNQLATLAGVPAANSTFRAYMAWLKRNGLVNVEGDMVRLNQP